MNRRRFHLQLTAALIAAPALARATPSPTPWAAIEAASGGRLGVAVLAGDGSIDGQRLDERFPLCSTFKWLAAACVLHRVDAGAESLQRRVRFDRSVLLPHSPLTAPHAGRDGMTLAQLCEAAITQSDNAAANLLLRSFGGPPALTAFARRLGDRTTRLDRREPDLNEGRPGDPRDTTTPRAMVHALHRALVGDALSPASRAQLARWMEACATDGDKLRAALPAGWRLGSKTGSGGHGTSNDVGIFWPPSGAPVLVAVYLTGSTASDAERARAIARVAAEVTARSR